MSEATPEPAVSPPAPSAVVPGLYWGLKRSFLDYVRRMPDGKGAVGAGAIAVGTHEVVFPPVSGGRRTGDDGVEERFWEFGGDVRFSGHLGMLFVRIALPALLVRDGVGELTVADPSREEGDERLALVEVALEPEAAPAGLEVWAAEDVRLTPAGSALFNDVYPPGEPFEPLRIVLPVQ